MLTRYSTEEVGRLAPDALGDALERGEIVHFPRCPIELPDEADLKFLREDLATHLRNKNVSYHPETDSVPGLKKSDPVRTERAQRILKQHARRVEAFLTRKMPTLTRDWIIGTSSFRPIQEKGRDLSPHASNELVHIDAGAYGPTHGDRVLRFFVNVNPAEDRVWATRGTFPELYARFGRAARITPDTRRRASLERGALDQLRTGFLRTLASAGLPQAMLIDSSPYDRTMRQFHNYMKDEPAFRDDTSSEVEVRFAPFSAWMVLTDMVSHASLSGQYALVNTFLLRLASCRLPQFSPYRILSAA
jgi:3-deoxy-D-manno-octulosonic acid hydroxylase-like protein